MNKHTLIVLKIALLVLSSCGLKTVERKQSSSETKAQQAKNSEQAIFKEISRPMVTMESLKTEEFRVPWFIVGLAAHVRSKSPELRYQLPKNADYVELLRCQSLNTFAQTVRANVLQNKPTEGWELTVKDGQCVSLTNAGFSQTKFLDVTAPSNTYRYLIRACVNRNRVSNAPMVVTSFCSNYISITQSDLPFVNERKQAELSAYDHAKVYIDQQNESLRKISSFAVELNNVKAKCIIKEADRQKAIAQQAQLSKIIGVGVSIADKVIGGEGFLSIAQDLSTLVATPNVTTLQSVGEISSALLSQTTGAKAGGTLQQLLGGLGGKLKDLVPNMNLDESSSSGENSESSEASSVTRAEPFRLPVNEWRTAIDGMVVTPMQSAGGASACHGETEINKLVEIEKLKLATAVLSYETLMETAKAIADANAAFEGRPQ